MARFVCSISYVDIHGEIQAISYLIKNQQDFDEVVVDWMKEESILIDMENLPKMGVLEKQLKTLLDEDEQFVACILV